MSLRILKIICAFSILANVALAAYLAFDAWPRERRHMIVAGSIRVAAAELPANKRRAFRQALRDARRESRPAILAGDRARDEAASLLRAVTLDPTALTAALGRARAADFAARAHQEERAVGFVANFSPSERAAIADDMMRDRETASRRGRSARR